MWIQACIFTLFFPPKSLSKSISFPSHSHLTIIAVKSSYICPSLQPLELKQTNSCSFKEYYCSKVSIKLLQHKLCHHFSFLAKSQLFVSLSLWHTILATEQNTADKGREELWAFPFSKEKVLLTVRWHRLPRTVVDSPSLETFKSHLDMVLGNLLQVALLKQGGWTRWPPEVPSSLSFSAAVSGAFFLQHEITITVLLPQGPCKEAFLQSWMFLGWRSSFTFWLILRIRTELVSHFLLDGVGLKAVLFTR